MKRLDALSQPRRSYDSAANGQKNFLGCALVLNFDSTVD